MTQCSIFAYDMSVCWKSITMSSVCVVYLLPKFIDAVCRSYSLWLSLFLYISIMLNMCNGSWQMCLSNYIPCDVIFRWNQCCVCACLFETDASYGVIACNVSLKLAKRKLLYLPLKSTSDLWWCGHYCLLWLGLWRYFTLVTCFVCRWISVDHTICCVRDWFGFSSFLRASRDVTPRLHRLLPLTLVGQLRSVSLIAVQYVTVRGEFVCRILYGVIEN